MKSFNCFVNTAFFMLLTKRIKMFCLLMMQTSVLVLSYAKELLRREHYQRPFYHSKSCKTQIKSQVFSLDK